MAKVTICINSEVEEEWAPLRDVLQRIAEAYEGDCSKSVFRQSLTRLKVPRSYNIY
jgi:hypothetical protein